MRKFILDFEFNETTGETRIVVDFHDESMSNMEINESIKNGEMLEAVIKETGKLFGEQIANRVKSGEVAAVCLDHHPELRSSVSGILINQDVVAKKEIKQ